MAVLRGAGQNPYRDVCFNNICMGREGLGYFPHPDILPFGIAGQVLPSPLAEVAWPEFHPVMMLKFSDPECSDAAVFKYQCFHPCGGESVVLYTSDHSSLTIY